MKLLVPIDFTPAANNALMYAAQLAVSCNGSIHLLHIVPTTAVERVGAPHPGNHQRRCEARVGLDSLGETITGFFGVRVTTEVDEGIVHERILTGAERISADTIVMTARNLTSSPHNSFEPASLFGGTTTAVMQLSTRPVLTVPPQYLYNQPSRIVFGTQNIGKDLLKLQELTNYVRCFDARIEVVRVVNRFSDEDDDINENAYLFRNQPGQSVSYPNVHCQEYQHTDTAEGILCFVEDQQADLLVLAPGYQPIAERLVKGNLNNEGAYQLEVPMLLLRNKYDNP